MRYVIEGADVPNVLRENRLRIKRGTLKVYPLDEEVPENPVDDTKAVEKEKDTKAAPVADKKEVAPADAKGVKPTDKKKTKTAKKK